MDDTKNSRTQRARLLLFYAQDRLWILHLVEPHSLLFHIEILFLDQFLLLPLHVRYFKLYLLLFHWIKQLFQWTLVQDFSQCKYLHGFRLQYLLMSKIILYIFIFLHQYWIPLELLQVFQLDLFFLHL